MAKCSSDHADCDVMRAVYADGVVDHYECKKCDWASPSRKDFQKSNRDLMWDSAFDAFERFMNGT